MKVKKNQSPTPEIISKYYENVISNTKYPSIFPKNTISEYLPETRMIIVDYELPNISCIPRMKEISYIKSKNEFKCKLFSDREIEPIYDNIIYQIALKRIMEIFNFDTINAITTVSFNGFVCSIDRSTGHQISPFILSIQVSKDEYTSINFSNISPKECFKKLKGVGSSKLYTITPIPPIVTINKKDPRFIESYNVANSINEGDNLAIMDWQDFEHLIREIFETEFASSGSEVKVTQSSRDGGVDAIVFDPDPIRGGKIIIQAKRYINTVGVSAVRDLYGTILNEGANKGILVTTSDYGPDAYKFAKNKPISLLNGSNLLHLLQKHGHKACIDIKAARDAFSNT
ncbi:restriction endonuclease [Methanospirillum sp. J.3.6.1-F.2.7.3]|uniref:Restriction endonuclease n=1 Tax=Methanospirillum purgamenti TaxID=2834276 RepID=A0A8E7B0E6_9EURY|nr:MULTISPECIES: restriction endonuclease [Methanospirillum]MDX8551978.1 restriction endonuclease [Methanospirillum hungatei]QVV89659.1 restriction endonuclease [Methanospirillum sp. J.3.6.1-F.2.7.3]